jgi:putative phosphoesterase
MSRERIGVISDTHGLLRPQAVEALQGSHLIIHAGDVGRESILVVLEQIAPVLAVRGNIDRDAWAERLPWSRVAGVGDVRLYVVHDIHTAGIDPTYTGIVREYAAIISGHSHRPSIETRNGVLLLNPGSAGPRRFHLPVTLAVIDVEDGVLRPQIVELKLKS